MDVENFVIEPCMKRHDKMWYNVEALEIAFLVAKVKKKSIKKCIKKGIVMSQREKEIKREYHTVVVVFRPEYA